MDGVVGLEGLLNRTQHPSDVIAVVVLWRLRHKRGLRESPGMRFLAVWLAAAGRAAQPDPTTLPTRPSYVGYRFPIEIVSYAVWLYLRFPLSLRHVDEILAGRGIVVSYENVWQWGLKFDQVFCQTDPPSAAARWWVNRTSTRSR